MRQVCADTSHTCPVGSTRRGRRGGGRGNYCPGWPVNGPDRLDRCARNRCARRCARTTYNAHRTPTVSGVLRGVRAHLTPSRVDMPSPARRPARRPVRRAHIPPEAGPGAPAPGIPPVPRAPSCTHRAHPLREKRGRRTPEAAPFVLGREGGESPVICARLRAEKASWPAVPVEAPFFCAGPVHPELAMRSISPGTTRRPARTRAPQYRPRPSRPPQGTVWVRHRGRHCSPGCCGERSDNARGTGGMPCPVRMPGPGWGQCSAGSTAGSVGWLGPVAVPRLRVSPGALRRGPTPAVGRGPFRVSARVSATVSDPHIMTVMR